MPILASLSVSRSDIGRMAAFYRALNAAPDFKLLLAAGGGHLDARLGNTINEFKDFGLDIDLCLTPTDGGVHQTASIIAIEFGNWLLENSPDALIVLGDRYEMLVACQAAILASVPIIHVGGGHLSIGAMDDKIRHAISKLSNLHFPASEHCAHRILSMHENPETVFITGAPELDAIAEGPTISREEFFSRVGLNPDKALFIATFHPETNQNLETNEHYASIINSVLREVPHQILLTAPCADPGNEPFLRLCDQVAKNRQGSVFIPSLGLQMYTAALYYCTGMLGNSSSGIIESATAKIPVVNVGHRQLMREHAANVIHTAFDQGEILDAIQKIESNQFREGIKTLQNPYGEGQFVAKAMAALRQVDWPIPLSKPWVSYQEEGTDEYLFP